MKRFLQFAVLVTVCYEILESYTRFRLTQAPLYLPCWEIKIFFTHFFFLFNPFSFFFTLSLWKLTGFIKNKIKKIKTYNWNSNPWIRISEILSKANETNKKEKNLIIMIIINSQRNFLFSLLIWIFFSFFFNKRKLGKKREC